MLPKRLLSLLLLVQLPLLAAAQQQPVVQLAPHWLVYVASRGSYVPHSTVAGRKVAAHCWLRPAWRHCTLRMPVQPGTCLLIDNQLQRVFPQADTVAVPLAPFFEGKRDQPIFLTLYHPQGQLQLRQAGLHAAGTGAVAQHAPAVRPLPLQGRVPWGPSTYAQVAAVLVLALGLLARRWLGHSLGLLFSLRDYLQARGEDYSQTSRRLLISSNVVLLAMALLAVALYLSASHAGQASSLAQQLGGLALGTHPGVALLVYSGSLLAYVMGIIGLVLLLSQLLSMQPLLGLHLFEIMRSLVWLAGLAALLLCGSLVGQWLPEQQADAMLAIAFATTTALRLWKVMGMGSRHDGLRGVYLFSYLCGTELLPVIALFKMLMRFAQA